MFIWMHGHIMRVPHSQLIVRLLADEVDALYLSLDSALDVCDEGADKVHSSTLPTKFHIYVDSKQSPIYDHVHLADTHS